MEKRMNLIDLANKNKKMDLDILRKAEEKNQELKKFGVNLDSHFNLDAKFGRIHGFFVQKIKE